MNLPLVLLIAVMRFEDVVAVDARVGLASICRVIVVIFDRHIEFVFDGTFQRIVDIFKIVLDINFIVPGVVWTFGFFFGFIEIHRKEFVDNSVEFDRTIAGCCFQEWVGSWLSYCSGS